MSEQLITLGEAFLRCLDALEDKAPGTMLSVPKIEALLDSNGISLQDDVSVTGFLDQLLRWGWIGTDNNGFDLVEQSFGISAKGQIRATASVDFAQKFNEMFENLPPAPDEPIELESKTSDNKEGLIELSSTFGVPLGRIFPPSEDAPASDRIVKLTDNQSALDEAVDAVSKLRTQLETGNDIGDLTSEEWEVAKVEVFWLEHALKQESLRVDWIEPLATKSLKWIAAKATEQLVGLLALAALSALATLFGFAH
jgi:hypothetical protein